MPLASDHLLADDQLTIGACDNSMNYSKEKFMHSMNENDALIWTFRNNDAILEDPKMYGWVEVDQFGMAKSVSCKVPISENPLNDHALVGAFSFKRADHFMNFAKKVISIDRRVNNEFYLDTVLDEYICSGYEVVPFEVNEYTCWGTPKRSGITYSLSPFYKSDV